MHPVLLTFTDTIFTPRYSETLIYWDTAQHLSPPGDRTPASSVETGNDDHLATVAQNETK